ncbi:MAG: hypothetical protein HFH55_12515 [Lachnospiraceae bacterium]|nr:hypothetical protein [Lachnospiraceae bacterium]
MPGSACSVGQSVRRKRKKRWWKTQNQLRRRKTIRLKKTRDQKRLEKIFSTGALLSVSWDLLRLLFSKGRKLEKVGLGLALGGGLNNLYNKKVKGYVNDYFSFGVKNERLKKTVFNLSDMSIFLGVLFYLTGQIISLCGEKEK